MAFRVFILLFLNLLAQVTFAKKTESANTEALRKCDYIAKAYTKCKPYFLYKDQSFYFPETATNLRCTDGAVLDFYQRMKMMDVASILMQPYSVGPVLLPVVDQNQDPGRLRLEDLLKSVYGRSEAGVQKNLVQVKFLGKNEWFQRRNGAALALKRVNDELMQLISTDETVKTFLRKFMGTVPAREVYTFEWRDVAGTNRLSPHSFGTAIDLVTNVGPQYWLWSEEQIHPEMAAQGEAAYEHYHYIPAQKPLFNAKVIQAFEKNGFIWGGKWNHFDTMHFEYRPEYYSPDVIDCSLD